MGRNALAGVAERVPALEAFAGRWMLERVIDDAKAGERLTAEGHVLFSPDDAGLVYDETSEMTLGDGRRLSGTRRYLWQPQPEGGIAVRFEDGRLFHRIAPQGLIQEDRHDCPPDLYAGAYDFTGWPEFRVRWQVSGPRKDYRMVTVYRRA